MKRILTAATIALVVAAVVHAQSALTGKWQGETKSGSQIVLDLKAPGTVLTGTLTVDGQPFTIAHGKVSKNTFTLTTNATGFTAEVAGDQITIWMDRRGPSSAAVLKRVKAQPPMTGKWQGETKNGSQIELDLTATETALTGTFTRNGQPVKIADGKVSEDTLTFKATLNDQTEGFTGKLTGDEITLWLDRQGPERAAVLKRVRK